jgi:hypothetical protein
MSIKIINLTIPHDKLLSDEINTFSPDENYLMIKIGCECLLEARKVVAGLSQDEIYRKIKEESKTEVLKLETELLIERETKKRCEEKISQIYEHEIVRIKDTFEITIMNHEKERTQLMKSLNQLNEQMKQYEDDTSNLCNSKLLLEREKCKEQVELVRNEYEKKGDKMVTIYESIVSSNNKSNSAKGSEGEKQFQELAAYTFKDFNGFEILDKHTKGGEGDFHLHFDEFNVLADAKNYKSNVPSNQREKIKKDLIKNEHIQFGWLVSLHSCIDKYDRAPIMYEWINTKQCLVYINNLCGFDDPSKILRIVWFTCKELNRFAEMNNEYDDEEVIELKEHKFMMMDKIRNLRKTVKEANTSMNTLKNIIQCVDEQLREMLGAETNELVDSSSSLFDGWWESNIEVVEDDNVVESVTEIWYKFRQENKDIIKQFDITMDKFKQFVKTKMPPSCIVTKTKSVNSTFDIKGVKIKKIIVETSVNEEAPVVVIGEKKRKLKKINKDDEIEYYISETVDKEVVSDYSCDTEDIFTIAKSRKLEVYQVLSVLIRNKAILKRIEARGYIEYTKSEHYQKRCLGNAKNEVFG